MPMQRGSTFPRQRCPRCGDSVPVNVSDRYGRGPAGDLRSHWCPHGVRCHPFTGEELSLQIAPGHPIGCGTCAKRNGDDQAAHGSTIRKVTRPRAPAGTFDKQAYAKQYARQMADRNGVVFYRGPSQFTKEPIVVVLTGLTFDSNNPKTGSMYQVQIIRSDMDPATAIATGADAAMCGDCRLRGDGVHGRGCFVTWWQAPAKAYAMLPRRTDTVDPWVLSDTLKGKWVRLGYYGDPASVPITVWAALLARAGGWVGYTQRWRTCDPAYKFFLMASCLTPMDYAEATAAGWRTYRVRSSTDDVVLPGEVVCPASNEADHKLTCEACGICQGMDARAAKRASAVIVAHGKNGNLKWWGIQGHHGRNKLSGPVPADPPASSPLVSL